MVHKTRGIVFRFTRYGETSIIVSIFTELFGLQSYIVNGVRSASARNKIALYQPLTLLELVVYHRPNANINRIKELRCVHPYQTITSDVRKSAIAIFLNELMNKTIKEESHAGDLCSFLINSLIVLDTLGDRAENFHLLFMIKLSRLLGFGAFNTNEVLGVRVVDEATEQLLDTMLDADYDAVLSISNDRRRELLDLMIKFYGDHIENLGEMRSLHVLKEVLS
ncbi:DNA repair protein RecO [Chryseolinea sp. T2]|uniref:DNA repair protein RecO n=1 Tax=Chryseolinea sp. T2 TaxID=3129255 RepID=UPI0030772E49